MRIARRTLLLGLAVATGAAGVAARPASATGSAPDAQQLLVPAPTLEDLGLTPRPGSTMPPLPEDPTCRHLVAALDAAAGAATSSAFQRWSTDDEERQLTNTVLVFRRARAARALVRAYRVEDPTEECVEALLVPQDPTVEGDIRGDDREGVRLGRGVVVVPYLAQATFELEDGELEIKAELVVARKGTVVSISFFVAPDDDFSEGARAVEDAVGDVLADVR